MPSQMNRARPRARIGRWSFAVLAFVSALAPAQQYTGLVVAVPAGDRVELQAPGQRMIARMADAVAPRHGGKLATAARNSLAALCLDKTASFRQTGTATDGSLLGHLSCAGRDVAQVQVRRGLVEVRPEVLAADSVLQAAVHEAQGARRGVWEASTRGTAR